MNIAAKNVFQDRWVKRSCSVSRVQKTVVVVVVVGGGEGLDISLPVPFTTGFRPGGPRLFVPFL